METREVWEGGGSGAGETTVTTTCLKITEVWIMTSQTHSHCHLFEFFCVYACACVCAWGGWDGKTIHPAIDRFYRSRVCSAKADQRGVSQTLHLFMCTALNKPGRWIKGAWIYNAWVYSTLTSVTINVLPEDNSTFSRSSQERAVKMPPQLKYNIGGNIKIRECWMCPG